MFMTSISTTKRMTRMPRRKSTAMQVAVYDVGNNPLPDKVVKEIEDAVTKIAQKHTTIALTFVTE